jgi:DegV family protein with EDD domain
MTLNHKTPIRIVTDSAARLPQDWATKNNVVILPHTIALNGTTYREDVDIGESDLANKAISLGLPFTVAAPSIEDFSRVYRQLADEKSDVISLHISSALSPAVGNAIRAKEEYRGRCDIQIIDSRSMALGLNELVRAAVVMAGHGFDAERIVKQLRGLMQHIYGIFVSDDMVYLEHSKRLRPAQAVLGKMLEIIPCLSLEEGDLVAVEKVRSPERAIEKLTEFAVEFEDDAKLAVLQLSPQPTERTQALIESLKLAFPDMRNVPVQSCGANVGSIIGPAGVGVMIYEGKI